MAKKIPKKINTAISQYITILKTDKLPIEQVFLFGSYAKGKQNKWSDIDLCVISPKFKDTWQAMQYLWSKRVFSKDAMIEPIGFSVKDFRENSTLTNEIKQTGIEIKI